MSKKKTAPDYVFESSWEVCNKVGGIYTVLSTKAHTLQSLYKDKVIFIGPDLWGDGTPCDFEEDNELFADWKAYAEKADNLRLKVGRWGVPGLPPVILVDFKPFFADKDNLFFLMWKEYQVNSLHAYGDYDESCVFALAVGRVIESFYHYYKLQKKEVVALFNEWMLSMGSLYVRKRLPGIATLFTTHATSIGRSIAGNNKALYAYMEGYNGDQMARELNMEAKHSVEKQAAHYADCFTTVSEITARECCQLLDKAPDIVTPNGFERNFVPEKEAYSLARDKARKALINVAEKLLGCAIDPDALLISSSGRYEYRNKGLDVYIEAMNQVRISGHLEQEIVAFITVPAWVKAPRADLKLAIEKNIRTSTPMQMPFSTHWLNEMDENKVLNYIRQCGFTNAADEKLKIIFVPCYLDGRDGIFNMPYYDLLIGMDATVYPSYYEPWGYTPLESIAFGIPTITTNLAGFGLWARQSVSGEQIEDGVVVVNRTDYNYSEVADAISGHILSLSRLSAKEREAIRKQCFKLAEQAEWSHFITHYQQAFEMAILYKNSRNS